MNRIVATMDDLPELPFEKVLSYLSLEDRLKARAVSRRWYTMINSFKVKTLCYSSRPSGFIFEKSRWVSGAFAQNFISSTRFASFFNTSGPTILANLKRLRICNLQLNEEKPTAFTEIFQSLGQLEELDIIRTSSSPSDHDVEFELSLPMLKSIRLELFSGINRLGLDAPRLQQVRLNHSLNRLDLVHVESVERVTMDGFIQIPLKQLKNLKQLYVRYHSHIDSTLLSGLEQLKEIHFGQRDGVLAIFEQKRRYGRADLKIYLYGVLLSGPEDPIIARSSNEKYFVHLIGSPLRLADEIPFHSRLHYSVIKRVAPEVAIRVMKKFINLETVRVDEPVEDIERFLDFLKKFDSLTELEFMCDQPQALFDRLPEHCAIQKLTICHKLPLDPQFLFRCKHLNNLCIDSIDIQTVRRILTELEFILVFSFYLANKTLVVVEIVKQNLFSVKIKGYYPTFWPNLNAAIKHMVEMSKCSESRTGF